MIISVINHTRGEIRDEGLQAVIRAINRQITEDFAPYWGLNAELRLEGRFGRASAKSASDMRGDAVLYLCGAVPKSVDGLVGVHESTYRGIPYGFVFTELSGKLDEEWSTTLSHEVLELIADPEVNLVVMGPHPARRGKNVFHWYEMCDAVQNESYKIDGVAVSNFVLPLYFTGGEERGGRNDFLGRAHQGKTLKSFGVNPGGYIGFYDPDTGGDDTFPPDDPVAAKRMQIKGEAKAARRLIRYRRFFAPRVTSAPAARRRPPTARG